MTGVFAVGGYWLAVLIMPQRIKRPPGEFLTQGGKSGGNCRLPGGTKKKGAHNTLDFSSYTR